MAEEKKIGAIKEELQAAEDSMLPDFITRYEKDERSGVKSLVEKARKRIQKLEAEYARLWQEQLFCRRTVTFYISMIPRNSAHPCVKNSMMKLWRRQWQQELEW